MFDRSALLKAFDMIGAAAVAQNTVLDIAIYRGLATITASKFQFATEDVDMTELGYEWPSWLVNEVEAIAIENQWSKTWLNQAVQFHLSPLADSNEDHMDFGTFPRSGALGLRVYIPTTEYMLALKLKAMRINDPAKGERETNDIRGLLRAGNIESIDAAVDVLAKFFPKSAREPDAQRFFLKHIWPEPGDDNVTPVYPIRSR